MNVMWCADDDDDADADELTLKWKMWAKQCYYFGTEKEARSVKKKGAKAEKK